jgi:hypothetical protein
MAVVIVHVKSERRGPDGTFTAARYVSVEVSFRRPGFPVDSLPVRLPT